MFQIPPLPDLVELAKEVEIGDPIDWGMLSIGEDEAYTLMAAHLIELFDQVPNEQRYIVAIASMTKLLVENFTLNLKLHTQE